jgi:3-(3-hydroxy-phenyl)propionate hydroxylase
VIGTPEVLAKVSDSTRQRWQHLGAVVLIATDPLLLRWLQNQHLNAVLLRPDRYIAGVARCACELDRICLGLLPEVEATH